LRFLRETPEFPKKRGARVAILDEKNLAAEAAKRATYRVHHVGTKLNEAEISKLEGLTEKRNQTQGELIRELILAEIARDAAGVRASAELTEITGVRLLLINLLKPVATGQPMTEKVFDGIVAEAKKRKAGVAKSLLEDLPIDLERS
jgi:hypothetical protein